MKSDIWSYQSFLTEIFPHYLFQIYAEMILISKFNSSSSGAIFERRAGPKTKSFHHQLFQSEHATSIAGFIGKTSAFYKLHRLERAS